MNSDEEKEGGGCLSEFEKDRHEPGNVAKAFAVGFLDTTFGVQVDDEHEISEALGKALVVLSTQYVERFGGDATDAYAAGAAMSAIIEGIDSRRN